MRSRIGKAQPTGQVGRRYARVTGRSISTWQHMSQLTRVKTSRLTVGLIVLLALAVGLAVVLSSSRSMPPLSKAQRRYLALAQQGVAKTSMWWDTRRGWYFDALGNDPTRPLADLWDSNGLFEALDEIALARPTAHNLAALASFANRSEGYWNRYLRPTPGYAPRLGDRNPKQRTWFDDNGWIGLAFLDAYRATGDTRYLTDAERAFRFIAAEGWDTAAGGGMWWSTAHEWRSGEALAAASDLAARLYQDTGKAKYLQAADKYVGWADEHLLQVHGVYLRTANTPYPYLIEPKTPTRSTPTASKGPVPSGGGPLTNAKVFSNGKVVSTRCPHGRGRCKVAILQGPGGHGQRAANAKPTMVAMPHDGEGAMISAITTLCEATGKRSWCKAAEKLAGATIVWLAPFADGPQYDSVLVRGLLTLYAHDHDPRWYRFAVAIAALITQHARTAPGVYLRGWDGRPVPSASPGMLRTDAGSIDVFADLATVRAPS